jgi:hypothetical protein
MNVNSNPTASQLNMKKTYLKIFFHLSPSPVSLTPVIKLYFRISPRIFIKIQYGPHDLRRSQRETDSRKKPSELTYNRTDILYEMQ